MSPSLLEVLSTSCFALAMLHTFLAKRVESLGHSFKHDSIARQIFHLLGELEVVFGFWAFLFLVIACGLIGFSETVSFLQGLNFTEPMFVFAVLAMASCRPVIQWSETLLKYIARLMPLKPAPAFYLVCLIVGPLLGSVITEPAAITVTALILLESLFKRDLSVKMKYTTFAVLLVNVSIGGTLTHFAAPPVVMVAHHWQWDTPFMFENFGWKAAIGVVINAILVCAWNWKELKSHNSTVNLKTEKGVKVPVGLGLAHLLLIALLVFVGHFINAVVAVFLLFLGLVMITKKYQDALKVRESLLVAFFLASLIVFGAQQSWWLKPILTGIDDLVLFAGATFLTGIADNAALTYLGSQIAGLSDSSKYFLVAGAVTGGGLTLVANAPNPAAYTILKSSFGTGIHHGRLFLAALIPTLVSFVLFLI